jgi:hypothetical protein
MDCSVPVISFAGFRPTRILTPFSAHSLFILAALTTFDARSMGNFNYGKTGTFLDEGVPNFPAGPVMVIKTSEVATVPAVYVTVKSPTVV